MKLPQRLVITFSPDGITAHVLYRTRNGPNPGTKKRAREAAELARGGLRAALAALEGSVESVGEAGFETREDSLFCPERPSNDQATKGESK